MPPQMFIVIHIHVSDRMIDKITAIIPLVQELCKRKAHAKTRGRNGFLIFLNHKY